MMIESTNVDLVQKPSFCQTPVTGSTGLNVLSLFDGVNPIFCLVIVVELCMFALWKNN